jgi:hypothetical protein
MLNAMQFINIYNEFLESGLTVRGFCANQNMKEPLFYYWQNKLRNQLPPKRGFVPVAFDKEEQFRPAQSLSKVQNKSRNLPVPEISNQPFFCEITYPNGVCLKLNNPTDPQMLRSLLLLTQQ